MVYRFVVVYFRSSEACRQEMLSGMREGLGGEGEVNPEAVAAGEIIISIKYVCEKEENRFFKSKLADYLLAIVNVGSVIHLPYLFQIPPRESFVIFVVALWRSSLIQLFRLMVLASIRRCGVRVV